MKKDRIEEITKRLVKITIEKHKNKMLGTEKMSTFIKRSLKKEISNEDYAMILHLYSRYLAREGYEIMQDINHFNIINYNSDEYQVYRNNLQINTNN